MKSGQYPYKKKRHTLRKNSGRRASLFVIFHISDDKCKLVVRGIVSVGNKASKRHSKAFVV